MKQFPHGRLHINVDGLLIEVYINHLRNKIGAARIKTRRGQGYVFADPE